MQHLQHVKNIFDENIQLVAQSCEPLAPLIVSAAELITGSLLTEHKLLCCGNGRSAADAQYFASVMLNRLELERPGLPAIALTADSSTITAIADDYQYADIYAKQIRALGSPADILLVISAVCDSHNLIHAIDAAHDREMNIIAITGRDGGQISELLRPDDIELRVPAWTIQRIQEIHLIIINSICDLIDQHLVGSRD